MNKLSKGTKLTLEYTINNTEQQNKKREMFLAIKELKNTIKTFPKKCSISNHLLFETVRQEIYAKLNEHKFRYNLPPYLKINVNGKTEEILSTVSIQNKLSTIKRLVDAELLEKRNNRKERRLEQVKIATNDISFRTPLYSTIKNFKNKSWY
jgi:hypothetical protein